MPAPTDLLLTDPIRSAMMSRVRRHGTTPEIAVAALLRECGLAYRKNVGSLPGRPDLANRKREFAVFVNGCFWHRHTACPHASLPHRNQEFWLAKFARNRKRDARAIRALRKDGFKVLVVWECQVRQRSIAANRLGRFASRVKSMAQPD